jgi:hypothetical protein
VLEEMSLSELREIVRQRGWPVKAGSKAECIAAIIPLMTDPTDVARAVTALPDGLRAALRAAFVAEDGNGINPGFLARVMNALSVDREQVLRPVEAAALLHDLARWGLIIPWRGFHNGPRFLFPSDVQGLVPPLPGWSRPARPAAEDSVLCRTTEQLVTEMTAAWELIAQEQPELRSPRAPSGQGLSTEVSDVGFGPSRKDPGPTPPTGVASRKVPAHALPVAPPALLLHDEQVQALSSSTGVGAEELDFICHLLCELGLASTEGGRLVTKADAMKAFLRASARQRQHLLAEAYLSLLDWSELDVLMRADSAFVLRRNPHRAVTHTQLRSQLVRLRHTVLRLLVAAGDERWCAFGDWDTALCTLWPDFFPLPQPEHEHWRFHGSQPAWQLSWEYENGEMSSQDGALGTVPGAFLRTVVQGPLYWLGFAGVGKSDGELAAVRLHGLGHLLWNRPVADAVGGASTEAVVIDAEDWTIAVQPHRAPAEIHPFLSSIAQLEEVSSAGYVYRLDMRTAHAAFGRDPLPALMAEWQGTVPVPIPKSMREALQDWWSRYGQAHLYEGLALLEVADDLAMQELEASSSLKQHTIAKLSPRLLVLPDRSVDALLSELTAKGHMPREVS